MSGSGKLTRAANGEWRARFRYGQARQLRVTLPAYLTAPQAERRLERLKELGAVVANIPEGEARAVLYRAAAAKTEELGTLERVAREEAARLGGQARKVSASAATFRSVGEQWTSGALARRFPDHVKAKRSAGVDASRLAQLYQTIGGIELREFTRDDAQRAMVAIPEGLEPATRRQYAQCVARVLNLAVEPLGLLDRSPLPRGWVPKGKGHKAKSFLYPVEEGRLLRCDLVPFARRLMYGVLAREGLRLGDAEQLRWRHVDLALGTIRLDTNKTETPRRWKMRDDVVRTLAAVKGDAEPDGLVFDALGRHAAKDFRRYLKLAKVDRFELFERNQHRQPIRVHDLRSTFVVLALLDGRSETFIMDRTGHTTSAMVRRYDRDARFVADLDLGQLGPLDRLLLPVPLPVPPTKGTEPMTTEKLNDSLSTEDRSRTGKPLRAADFESEQPVSVSTPAQQDQQLSATSDDTKEQIGPAGTPLPVPADVPADAAVAALVESLKAATEAGAWGAVAELAGAIKALRAGGAL